MTIVAIVMETLEFKMAASLNCSLIQIFIHKKIYSGFVELFSLFRF